MRTVENRLTRSSGYNPWELLCNPLSRVISTPSWQQSPVKERQCRWSHLDQFNLGFTPKIVFRRPTYLRKNRTPRSQTNPWNIEYSSAVRMSGVGAELRFLGIPRRRGRVVLSLYGDIICGENRRAVWTAATLRVFFAIFWKHTF